MSYVEPTIFEMVPVDSSNIDLIGYDNDSQVLQIAFKGGGLYQYADVPVDIYNDLMTADSKGSYFYYNVRKGGFSFEKVN